MSGTTFELSTGALLPSAPMSGDRILVTRTASGSPVPFAMNATDALGYRVIPLPGVDNYAQILAAVTLLATAGGGELTVAGGVYMMSAVVAQPANVVVRLKPGAYFTDMAGNPAYGIEGSTDNWILYGGTNEGVLYVADATIRAATAGGAPNTAGHFVSAEHKVTTPTTPPYERMGYYCRIVQYDASVPNSHDSVAFQAQAQTGAGNTNGRLWTYAATVTIAAGQDAYANSYEGTIENNGSDAPLFDTVYSKLGITMLADGNHLCTAAFQAQKSSTSGPGGGWQYGFVARQGAIFGYSFAVLDTSNIPIWTVDRLGNQVTQNLQVNGSVGFFGRAPAAKPVVSGSKASGAAWTSLLAALVSLGLVTDSTTA